MHGCIRYAPMRRGSPQTHPRPDIGPGTRSMARALVATALLLTLTGCVAASTLAVQATPSGEVRLLLARCSLSQQLHVTDVRLVKPASDGNFESRHAVVLWRITSSPGGSYDTLVIGKTPPGSRLVVPLSTMPSTTSLIARVFVDGVEEDQAFVPATLPADGRVSYDGRVVTRARFLASARGGGACSTTPSRIFIAYYAALAAALTAFVVFAIRRRGRNASLH